MVPHWVYQEVWQRFGSIALFALVVFFFALKGARSAKHRIARILLWVVTILAGVGIVSAVVLPIHLPLNRIVIGKFTNDPTDAVRNDLAAPIRIQMPDVGVHYSDLPSDPDRLEEAFLWSRLFGCLIIYPQSRQDGDFLSAIAFVGRLEARPIEIGLLTRNADGRIKDPVMASTYSAGMTTLWLIWKAARNPDAAAGYRELRQIGPGIARSPGGIPNFYGQVLELVRQSVKTIVIRELSSSEAFEATNEYADAIEHLKQLGLFPGLDDFASELAEKARQAISRAAQYQSQAILQAISKKVSPNEIRALVDGVLPLLNNPYSSPSTKAALLLAEGKWLEYTTISTDANALRAVADKFSKALGEFGKFSASAEDIARTHATLGDVYLKLFRLGDPRWARLCLEAYDKALEYFTADKDEWAAIESNRVFVSLSLGLTDSEALKVARGKLEFALTLFHPESHLSQRVAVLNTLGSLCLQMTRFEDAAAYYSEIIYLTVGSHDLTGERAAAMTNLARSLRQMGGRNPAQLQHEAIAWYTAALQIRGPREEFVDFWAATKYHLGQAYFQLYKLGDESAAQAALREVDESLELLKKQDPFRKKDGAKSLKRAICAAALNARHVDLTSCQGSVKVAAAK